MLFKSFSAASLAIIASALILLLTPQATEAHSYVDCVDWRFTSTKNKSWSNKNGACFGYARRFPVGAKPFAKLDSDDPNRHYEQSNSKPMSSPACSNGRDGSSPGADETQGKPVSSAYNGKDRRGRKTGPQTVTKRGGQLCVRWPAKNHAVPSEKNRPVFITFSPVNYIGNPTQQALKNMAFHTLELNYKNCTDKGSNEDIWPCGGCFSIPSKFKDGNYLMNWRWQLNSNEFYTSCADVLVKG